MNKDWITKLEVGDKLIVERKRMCLKRIRMVARVIKITPKGQVVFGNSKGEEWDRLRPPYYSSDLYWIDEYTEEKSREISEEKARRAMVTKIDDFNFDKLHSLALKKIVTIMEDEWNER